MGDVLKKNILLSGLGGSLFPYLLRKLSTKFNAFYIDSDKEIKNIYREENDIISPFVNSENFISFITRLIVEKNIEFYIPLIDEELLIAKQKVMNTCDINVIAPESEFIKLCLDKYELMNQLAKQDISKIPTYRADNFIKLINFPLFLKPLKGRGSRGIFKVNDEQQFESYFSLFGYNREDIIVQPYIEGTEYTVGVLCNRSNDIICLSSKRIIRKRGITQIAVTENNRIIESLVYKLVESFKPSGPFNVQLFLSKDDNSFIFEINPRFSTTSILEYEGGLDLIELYIKHCDKRYSGDVLRPVENLRIHRRWESLFYYE